jgi:Tol biopolymer transport system component/DNA-binding winged helix-turn-helix (wHTH) protein
MLKFGPYLVDLEAGEIRKNGFRIRLQEKPLRVLALLAERQDQVVTREELKKHLWPDDTFVDFDTGLNTAVRKLRDALSDSSDKPRYIETIPRRGYRFVARVEIIAPQGRDAALPASIASSDMISDGGVAPVAGSTTAPVRASGASGAEKLGSADRQIAQIRSAYAAMIWGTVAAAVALLVLTVWWLTPVPDPRMTEIFRVTQSGRLDYLVRPATDGVRIFYVQRAGDRYDLMQAPVNGGEAQKIDAPFPNTMIWDISLDGSQYLITSFTRRGKPSPLWSWPASGGSPLKVGDLVSGSATFSPDGKKIAYHIDNDLLIANPDGTGVRKLATFHEQPDSPVWSPDGRRIRFNLNNPERDTGEIWEIASDGSNLRPVLPHWQETSKQCCGTWTPDGRYFVFVDNSQVLPRLYALREKREWWRRSPRGPFLLAAEATGSWSPLVSRDGTHVFYYGTNVQTDLESLDVSTGQFSPILKEKSPTMLSVSRDGQWVSYVDSSSGILWASHLDGSAARQIQSEGMHAGFPRFSPDNGLIAFTAFRDGVLPNVYLVSASGGTPRPVFSDPGGGLGDPDWSPDGSRLVVARDLPSAQRQQISSMLAFVDLRTSQITSIPGSEDLHMPRWSPDGRFIAADRGNHSEIVVLDTRSHEWSTVARGSSLSFSVWSADGADLTYQDALGPGQPLYRVHLATGARTMLASFQKALDTGLMQCAFVDLSPDGAPVIAFDRRFSDIYGARLLLP